MMNPQFDDGAQAPLENERSSRTILLIDRLDTDRQPVRQHLSSDIAYHYEFINVSTGEEALKVLGNSTVDCLILEQYLEDISAIELLFKLGKIREDLRPPVVILASGGNLESAVEALQSGAQDFLVKEKSTPETVQRAVNNAIEKVKLRRALSAQQAALSEELAERRRVQELLGTQMRVLKSIALGRQISEVLEVITTEVEACIEGSLSSILLVSKDGKQLHRGSVNSLPEEYNKIVEGVEIAPRVGSCGSAAHLKQRVIAADIATDYNWEDYAHIALSFDLRSCWSTPILSPDGEMVGALAVYFHEPRSPIPSEIETLDMAAYLAGIAIERRRSDELLRESRERLQLALRGGSLGVWEWDSRKKRIELDDKVLNFLGLRNTAPPIPISCVLERVHPDDVEMIYSAVRSAMTNASLYEATCRIINTDGSFRGYLRTMGDLQFDDSGEIIKIVGVAEDVTVEAQAAEALQRSEQHLRDVADNLLCMIAVLTPEGIVQWVNQAAVLASHGAAEDFCEHHFADGPPWRKDQNARQRIFDAIRRVNEGETVRYDTTVIIEEQSIDIDVMLVPLRDRDGQVSHIVASGLDISERKRAERQLRENEELAQRILQSSPECVQILDVNGRLLEMNQPGREMLEIEDFEQVRNKLWREMWPVESHNELDAALEKAVGGIVGGFQGFCPTFKGTPKWLDVMLAPVISPDGRMSRVIASSRDISSAKILEAQRENILQAEHAARLELEQTNRAKDEFLATLSHELRTPLTSIIGWVEILRDEARVDASIRARGYDVVERNARAQHQLIEDILDVSRIIAGQLKIKTSELLFESLVELSIETFRPKAQEKNIELVSDIESVPLMLGDTTRLQQVVWNLLSNAIKFTPEGGKVRVVLREENGYAHLEIQDNGVGIPIKFLPNVFDRFRQADSSSTRRHSGLGLGLAIVKHLVELHGGTVTATSDGPDQGATFIVNLPLRVQEVQTVTPAPASSSESPLDELKGRKLLVVDDEPDVLYLVRRLLEKHGAQVETAAGASEAIERLDNFSPDVLISDIGMPETDGYMLMEQLRDRYPQGKLPFPALALTAYSSEQDRLQILSAGFAAHLSKPLRSNLIIQRIQGLLDKQHEQQKTALN
jgi:PAS domain S-box-containing protein